MKPSSLWTLRITSKMTQRTSYGFSTTGKCFGNLRNLNQYRRKSVMMQVRQMSKRTNQSSLRMAKRKRGKATIQTRVLRSVPHLTQSLSQRCRSRSKLGMQTWKSGPRLISLDRANSPGLCLDATPHSKATTLPRTTGQIYDLFTNLEPQNCG